jgi:thioredoxin reductase (NADPH)
VATYTRLVRATATPDGLACVVSGTGEDAQAGERQLTCARLVLATGYYDNPNQLGVPGESLPHVSHYFDEAHRHYDRDVVVVGGRNSAVEAALELFRAGARVTLVYRGTEFPSSVKYWVKPDIENRIKAGEVQARLGATVTRFEPGAVVIRTAEGRDERLPADRAFALIGYHPNFALFDRLGVTCDPETGRPTLDPDTQETNVPGIYMAGSIIAGRATAQVFIENGRFDGEKIFAA